MAATILATQLGDIEDTDKLDASKSKQTSDQITTENGLKASGGVTDTPLGMDHSKENFQSGSNASDPHSEPAQIENEADDDSTDFESEPEDDDVQSQPKMSDRKRTQYKKFSSWLSQHAETVTTEEVKAAVDANDEALSIRSLMSKQESTVLINDARGYQVELFEKAKKQNTIAVLDTGSGKTLIAVLLLKHIIDVELEDRGMGKKPRISFFLVDCVTLVFQQFAVLESNLGHKVERFCGEMGCDLWAKKTWDKHFTENMVIVCTAEILHQCLMHSFIALHQINLLIFDEAHHAKKNHAYARIIKDFYITEVDLLKRPRVFGMTASPVDAREDVIKAAKELETMLDSQIATASDLSLLRMSISRPNESIAVYEKLRYPYTTPLSAALKEKFGDEEVLSKLFKFAREATSELGEWCADRVWSMALVEEEAIKMERKVERLFHAGREIRPIETLDAELARLREAKQFVADWTFTPPSFTALRFEKATDARCIVFVKRRYTARLLKELLAQIGTEHLRIGLLIGTRYGDPGDVKVSFRQQVLELSKFRKGEINCLLATSIAEEGLDIPYCNLVVRFDLYSTLIQYIQSRGRARHANSRYIHMIEADNRNHLQAIKDVRSGEDVMREFCEALPADRKLQGNDCDTATAFAKERTMRKYTDPDTGATLTYGSSLVILSHFLGCLPHRDDAASQATFVMTVEHKQFVCEVILPENSPVLSAIGRPAAKKSIAKRSAAFEACLILRKGGHLDGHLIPTYHKQLPAMRNAHLALNMKQTNSYDMKIKPSLWENALGSRPETLFMTVLEVETPENLRRSYQPLALLTRTHLLDFPAFPLYLQVGSTTQIISTSILESVQLVESSLAELNSFTLRIYKDIFNKEFEDNIPNMSYWLAPVVPHREIRQEEPSPASLIDWQVLKEVHMQEELGWDQNKPNSYLENRYFVDRWSGGRRFFSVRVVPELGPDDLVPEDAAASKDRKSIMNYTVTLFKKSRERAKWSPNQPVVLAECVPYRLHWLDDFTEKEIAHNSKCYICPEPLLLSALPTSVVSMGYLFPAIITRFESYLIAQEVSDLLGLKLQPALALEAITKDSDNTEEHRKQQVHVQRGMGKNYERLEFIGDCFLKMATSISLFAQNPDNNEYEYHVKRMLLICNKNLFGTALQKRIYAYIRTMGFSRRNWYPQGIKLLKGKGHKKTGTEIHKHHLGDKTIADVCEAIIGAALLSYEDTGNMDMAVKAVTALVSSLDHDVSEWADYYRLYSKPRYQIAKASAAHLDLATKIEQKHNYHFKYPRLLQSAFIHPSLPSSWSDKIPCYQRLEFLGDSLLDMACINFLFHRHPDQDPQWLTEHKMAMVSNKFLAALAARLEFHRHVRVAGSLVEYQNREYVAEIQEAEAESNGSRDYWMATKNPPKCLSDVVEAYIGAIFVDSEFDFKEVERFFDAHIRWYFEDMSIYDTFANNHPTVSIQFLSPFQPINPKAQPQVADEFAKTLLHTRLTMTYGCVNYRLMANELPSPSPASAGFPAPIVAVVMIHDEIIANASASSGKNAKVKASEKALILLDGLAPFEFRARFGCNCEGVSDDNAGMAIGVAVGSAI